MGLHDKKRPGLLQLMTPTPFGHARARKIERIGKGPAGQLGELREATRKGKALFRQNVAPTPLGTHEQENRKMLRTGPVRDHNDSTYLLRFL